MKPAGAARRWGVQARAESGAPAAAAGLYFVDMAFCSHCGRAASEEERVCAGCGAPMAPDAVAAMTAEQRRQRRQMRLLVGVTVVALAVVVGVVLKEAWPAKQGAAAAPAAAAPAAPAQSQAAPASTVQTSSDQAASPAGGASQQESPAQAPGNPAAAAPAPPGGIDLGEVQKALAQMTQRSAAGNPEAPAATAPSGSDRYPGSQPVNVDDAQLPDIGIPVAREVYSTTDSVATVIRYYQQRYPDARLMEINGQQVLAVDRPGLTKVIAIGSSGQETRIAIVRPGS